MIMRIWRGRVPTGKSDAYVDYVRRTGLAGLGSTEGNLGAWTFRRKEGGETEFLVMSLWESMQAVRRFAGPAPEEAVYYPEDRSFLLELEPHVRHYEVAGHVPPPAHHRESRAANPQKTSDEGASQA